MNRIERICTVYQSSFLFSEMAVTDQKYLFK
uniref:Uncharacterized protein n=1 Tax=Anguilla anguilla TaxID=7936 RepID=A0A0E9RV36_ANGAN